MTDDIRESLHNKVTGFMDANYPCDCKPEDTECPKNSFEADHILDVIGDAVKEFVSSLDESATRDDILAALNAHVFIPKEVTSYGHQG